MAEPRPTGRRFAPRELPAADAASYFAERLAAAPYRYRARITVRAPAQAVTSGAYPPLPGTVEPIDDESCVVHVRAESPHLAVQQVLAVAGRGHPYTLSGDNPELVERLREIGSTLGDL